MVEFLLILIFFSYIFSINNHYHFMSITIPQLAFATREKIFLTRSKHGQINIGRQII